MRAPRQELAVGYPKVAPAVEGERYSRVVALGASLVAAACHTLTSSTVTRSARKHGANHPRSAPVSRVVRRLRGCRAKQASERLCCVSALLCTRVRTKGTGQLAPKGRARVHEGPGGLGSVKHVRDAARRVQACGSGGACGHHHDAQRERSPRATRLR